MQSQQFTVPRKIRLMSHFIHEQLKADPSQTSLQLPIDADFLKIIINYCEKFNFLKVMSTITFPASHNELQKNVTFIELHALQDYGIQQNLELLRKLLVYCKKLQIEALYELSCIAIACYFKTRANSDVQQQFSNLQRQQQYDEYMQRSTML